MDKLPMFKVVARIHSDFPDKFGIPRQSGLVKELRSQIIFEPEYRNPDALRGLEGFSHLWLLWYFSENGKDGWSPTVRPPRLGGNKRMGVFATRSPFRPNPIGLSCVKIESVELTNRGPVITVSGADLMDGTPILDVKPYLPFTDSHPEAVGGFAEEHLGDSLEVRLPEEFAYLLTSEQREALEGVLGGDPRPSYQNDPERVYKMDFAQFKIEFKVDGNVLNVVSVSRREG